LYLTHANSSIPRDVKELKGFKRVFLAAGETKTVTFMLTNDELYHFNETTSMYEVEAGAKTIRVGTSSDRLSLTGTFTVLDGVRKPDLRIMNIRMVPPYPLKNQKVTFAAMVKNEGTGATAAGTPLKISYRVNGKESAWSTSFAHSIPIGGMAYIQADGGPNSTNLWSADSVMTVAVDAVVDPDNTVDECVELNNTQTTSLKVYPQPPTNLALNKSVAVSSFEKAGLEGIYAVDGNLSTRWSSAFSDPQFIIVDLGSLHTLSEILLYWETAYAKAYQVQLSDDGTTFRTIFTETNGDGGIDKIVTTEQCRYVKIYCQQRGSVYGYSLFEIVVHGQQPSGVNISSSNFPDACALYNNYPNPFNPVTTISYDISHSTHVRLSVTDLLGREVILLVDEKKEAGRYVATVDAGHLSSGVYFYTLLADSFRQTKRMVLIR
jgi:hypothetical protein